MCSQFWITKNKHELYSQKDKEKKGIIEKASGHGQFGFFPCIRKKIRILEKKNSNKKTSFTQLLNWEKKIYKVKTII